MLEVTEEFGVPLGDSTNSQTKIVPNAMHRVVVPVVCLHNVLVSYAELFHGPPEAVNDFRRLTEGYDVMYYPCAVLFNSDPTKEFMPTLQAIKPMLGPNMVKHGSTDPIVCERFEWDTESGTVTPSGEDQAEVPGPDEVGVLRPVVGILPRRRASDLADEAQVAKDQPVDSAEPREWR